MEKETTILLEKLAQKLGTTGEYLWTVLLKQSPVSATTSLFYLLLMSGLGLWLYKVHKHLSNDDNKMSYYEKEEAVGVPMTVLVVIWMVLFIACIFDISNIINGYLNPEYWAFNKVLQAID